MQSPLAVRIRKKTTEALSYYDMIAPGDRIMVCTSGGKDSTILALTLKEIQKRAAIPFTMQAVLLDQKQPGFDADAFCQWMAEHGVPVTILAEDTYAIVQDKTAPGKTYCGLCSRLRRGIFYNYAAQEGYDKIALGHHRDDLNQTLLLNLFYGGRIASMPPKLLADDKRNTVIRPLALVPEEWLIALAQEWAFPVIPCNLCGSQENLKRQKIKALLASLGEENSQLAASLLTAQQNVRLTQLADQRFLPGFLPGSPS